MTTPVQTPDQFEVFESKTLVGLLKERFLLSIAEANSWIEFGRIYCNRLRVMQDRELKPGDWLRVHRNPRRFPCDSIDWAKCIVEENLDYVVVNKPAGIPVHATCDNAVENIVFQISKITDCELKLVHRLDVATQGLLIFARSTAFRRSFNEQLENRSVVKKYRALVSKSVARGEYIHYMKPSLRAPREVFSLPQLGWKMCALEIQNAEKLPRSNFFELEILLKTGRNHQIRSQLAKMGSPIVGDFLYGSQEPFSTCNENREAIALQCFSLEFSIPGQFGPASYLLPSFF